MDRGRQPDGTVPLVPSHEEFLFAGMAERYHPGLGALQAAMRPRQRCPICQHPTGDCTGEH